jgi:hypothetical protein
MHWARIERFEIKGGVKAVRGHAVGIAMLAGRGGRARPLLQRSLRKAN